MKQEHERSPDNLLAAFSEIYRRSLDLIEEVSPTSDLLPLKDILGPLQSELEARHGDFFKQTRHLAVLLNGQTTPVNLDGGVGLNTVGMLSDRLSILAIKQHRLGLGGNGGTTKSDALYQTQTLDILAALSTVRPGNSALNTKITTLPADAEASSWIDAYFGLLSTNLLLWEAQEILYLKDILLLPPEELRGYIQWFAVGNMRRNRYMELCEILFWKRANE